MRARFRIAITLTTSHHQGRDGCIDFMNGLCECGHGTIGMSVFSRKVCGRNTHSLICYWSYFFVHSLREHRRPARVNVINRLLHRK